MELGGVSGFALEGSHATHEEGVSLGYAPDRLTACNIIVSKRRHLINPR